LNGWLLGSGLISLGGEYSVKYDDQKSVPSLGLQLSFPFSTRHPFFMRLASGDLCTSLSNFYPGIKEMVELETEIVDGEFLQKTNGYVFFLCRTANSTMQ
jgi:hypothetical protein